MSKPYRSRLDCGQHYRKLAILRRLGRVRDWMGNICINPHDQQGRMFRHPSTVYRMIR